LPQLGKKTPGDMNGRPGGGHEKGKTEKWAVCYRIKKTERPAAS
jgi:hypothetical protein